MPSQEPCALTSNEIRWGWALMANPSRSAISGQAMRKLMRSSLVPLNPSSSRACTNQCSSGSKTKQVLSTRSMSGAQLAPTFVVHPTGRARLQANARCATCDRLPFWETTSPPITCRHRTRSLRAVLLVNTSPRWVYRRKILIPTPLIGAIT